MMAEELLCRVMLESDAPHLGVRHPNYPHSVVQTAIRLSELWEMTEAEVLQRTTSLFEDIFNISA